MDAYLCMPLLCWEGMTDDTYMCMPLLCWEGMTDGYIHVHATTVLGGHD